MAKKKDGITNLTKLSVLVAAKLTPSQYSLYKTTIFALLNGVQYGYTELGPKFLEDANDIYSLHSKGNKTKKILVKVKSKTNKSNIIDFNSYKREDAVFD